MRVLFVYSNQTRDVAPAAPIGLAYVATATAAAGHDVRVEDLLFRRSPLRALRKAVEEFRPHVVAFSVRNIDNVLMQRVERHLGELAAQLKVVREASDALIVLGGPAISILREAALKRLDADYAVAGEGEEAFPALLAALERGETRVTMSGVLHRDAAGGVYSEAPHRLPSFGASGLEKWIDWAPYARRGATWPVQTKRGCPLHCIYCTYPQLEGASARLRNPEDVVDEIARIAATVRPRAFEFVDSTFNVPPTHAAEICEVLARRALRVPLSTMGFNPLGSSPALLQSMKAAGFNAIMVTPDSANDAMLRRYRKGFTLEHLERCADDVERSGISSAWFFMFGAPGETKETVDETLRFVERRLTWDRCLAVAVTGIRVLPGSPLAHAAGFDGEDLVDPKFYLADGVDEAWVLRRINATIVRRPNVVHSCEDGNNVPQRIVDALLNAAGVAPPYWRFTPRMLRTWPIPWLRAKYPPAGERAFLSS